MNCVILSQSWDIWGQTRFFLEHTCRHNDNNSTKKHTLNKRRHGLCIDRLLYHINYIGACCYHPKQFWSLLCEKLLSVSSEQSYLPPPKFLDRNCLRPFGGSIGFVYITSEQSYLPPKVSRQILPATFWGQHWICLHYSLQCYHRTS